MKKLLPIRIVAIPETEVGVVNYCPRDLYGVNGTMNPLCFSWLCKVRIEEKPTNYISKESSCITEHDCGG